jgi:hypothetical protein
MKKYLPSLLVLKEPMDGIPFWLYIATKDAMSQAVLT